MYSSDVLSLVQAFEVAAVTGTDSFDDSPCLNLKPDMLSLNCCCGFAWAFSALSMAVGIKTDEATNAKFKANLGGLQLGEQQQQKQQQQLEE